jgi:predicted RNase H-like HicB family nuclease
MLTTYIQAAMSNAKYELLDDDEEPFYGETPDCPGVWSTGKTLTTCQENLQDALEGWIILGLRLGHTLPIINGVDLNPQNQQEVA